MNSEKWVFTVHPVTACSFLFYCQNVTQIFSAIFSMIDQKSGMENIISYEYIFFEDREGKTDISPFFVSLDRECACQLYHNPGKKGILK